MRRRYRIPIIMGSVVLVAALSFLATRSMLPGAAGAGGPEGAEKVRQITDKIATSVASGTPPATPPKLGPTEQAKADQLRATIVAGRQESFVGELNGFTFYDQSKGVTRAYLQSCGDRPLVPVNQDARLAAGAIAFTVGYWPEEVSGPRQEETKGCDRDGEFHPVSYLVSASTTDFKVAGIFRQEGAPIFRSGYSKEQLTLLTIGSRPSLIASTATEQQFTIFMRDDQGTWYVTCAGFSKDKCIRMAEEVK